MTQDSQRSGEGSQVSSTTTSGGAKEARKKASERLGQWIRRKYCLESLLGVGGMATVYAARHRNGSRAALKILHAEFAREEGVKTRFLREGYVANKVNHPGVVRIQDDDETEQGEPYLVMELLTGLTLQQLWKRRKRKVPPGEALHICAEVLDTLVPFHEISIIHRDLKPANIFICDSGRIKLLDFGVAQMREAGEALTRAGTALGTPSFMSPEQAMGKSDQLDGRSDVFAIGATLYAILGGKRLHHGKSDNEAFILAATQPAPSLARVAPELPVEVIALVDRALQWDRRKRFRTAAEFRDAARQLSAALGGAASLGEATAHSPRSMPGEVVAANGAPAPGAAAAQETPELRDSRPTPMTAATANRHSSDYGDPHRPSAPTVGASPAAYRGTAQHAVSVAPSQPPPAELQQVVPPPRKPSVNPQPPAQDRSARPPPAPERASSRPPPADRTSSVPAASGTDHPMLPLFERFEKALPSLRHYGLSHPEGEARVRNVHGAIIDALREMPQGLRFEVHPFCFSDAGTTLWEPGPPHDQVPYAMASSGVEEVHINAGVTEAEVHAFLKATVIDPQLGLTEGDVGAALWEAGLDHITCQVREDMTDADAREQIRFFSESEEIEADIQEELARLVTMMAQTGAPSLLREDRAEAAAMALTTDTESFRAARNATGALRVDDATKQALAVQLNISSSDWRDRFFDAAPFALADALARQDGEILWSEVRHYTDKMVHAAQWQPLLSTFDTLYDRIAAKARAHTDPHVPRLDPDELVRQVFRWDVVNAAFSTVAQKPGDHDELETHERIRDALTQAVPVLPKDLSTQFITLASALPPGELQNLALSYVNQNIEGTQQLIINMLDQVEPTLAQRLLEMVARSIGDQANDLLKPILMSPNPALRCEATALLANKPEVLGRQLVRLLGSADPRLRSASLTTMLRHNVRQAGPGLIGVIEEEGFAARPASEKRQMFDTLYALNPRRAESFFV